MANTTSQSWRYSRDYQDSAEYPSQSDPLTHTSQRLVSSVASPRQRHATLRLGADSPFPPLSGGEHILTVSPPLSTAPEPLYTARHKRSGLLSLLRLRLPFTSSLYTPRAHSRLFWLALYFSFNLVLTLSNKSVLSGFPFPYTLTALHALCSTLGGLLLRACGAYTHQRLGWRDELALAAFSFLYGINVAVSNVSLHLVTVPFHQVVRAITPICTMMLSSLLFGTTFSQAKLVSLTPVVLGVVLATYGDYYFTFGGLLLTLLGTVLAALKTIFTNILQSSAARPHDASSASIIPTPASWRRQTSPSRMQKPSVFSRSSLVRLLRRCVPPQLNIHPLDLLTRMSPLAFVQCVLYAQASGELDRLRLHGLTTNHALEVIDVPIFASAVNVTQALNAFGAIDCVRAGEVRIVGGITLAQALVLLFNGCLAFGLNVVSFSANGKVGPLSMTVAANVKQVLTILCAVSLFNLTITPMNALGISTTLVGGAWYAWVEYSSKLEKAGRKADH